MGGLVVKVYNNNVELALKKLKRKVKNSGMLLELKKRAYFQKPSKLKREKINLSILRNKWAVEKENNQLFFYKFIYLYTQTTIHRL